MLKETWVLICAGVYNVFRLGTQSLSNSKFLSTFAFILLQWFELIVVSV